MNIRDNITNYLFDKDYLICIYENNIYIFNYKYLERFGASRISVRINDKYINISGNNLSIIKITKEEMLIKGNVQGLEILDE